MLKRYQRIVGEVCRVGDAAVIVAAWLASYWLRFYAPSFPVTKGLPSFETYASLSPLVAVLWMTVFAFSRVYESRRLLSLGSEVWLMTRAHGTAMLVFIAVTSLFDDFRYSRLVMVYFGVLGGVALIAVRLTVRTALRAVRKRGYNLRHIVAVGEGPVLDSLLLRLDTFPELGFRVHGVVTQEGAPHSGGRYPVVGHFGQIDEIVRKTRVDEVLIALPHHQQHETHRLLSLLKDEAVEIRLVPDVHGYAALGCNVEEFDGVPVVRINDSPLIGWSAWSKRLTDIVLSAVGLVAISPLLLLIAALVKLTSRGPVLYAQERMGLDGRTFKMLKFRSMRVDAEDGTGAVWARPGDDRRTPIGAFLRKTSLDELPQLWNVLRGDMSLVGPRPERPVFVHQFRKEIPHYMLRHKVKAGITGWAQVNGWRGNTSLDRRIECDLYYIQNWSYSLDMKILTLTLWKGFINKNAY